MPKYKYHQASFHAGEIAPEMFGRTDDVKQVQGLATCQNFICTPQGPVENRAGTEFVRAVKTSSKPVRLIPFVRGDESMVLEFGDKYIRFHTQGATLLKNGSPYEVVTPYDSDDIFELTYSQSIDVLTLCHPQYPARDLKRYGATDWRLELVKLNNVLAAPTGVAVTYHCQDEGSSIQNKTAFTLSYVVTACDENGEHESEASAVASVQGNLYINSAYARISWNAVSGAKIYKVYKYVGGLYGYIGQTQDTYIEDDNISADQSITPKRLDDAFGLSKSITAVSVTNQGSGYYGTREITSVSPNGYRTTPSYEDFSDDPSMAVSLPVHLDSYGGTTSIDYCEVRDRGGTGSGAVVQVYTERYGSYGRQRITGFKIVNPGKNYTDPVVCIEVRYGVAEGVENFCFPVQTALGDASISLVVSDSTGSGAVLKPSVSNDGKITGVTIVSGGSNYTSPTIAVLASSGSGATFSATVGSGSTNPVSATRFEQRRVFTGSLQYPQHVWMTRTGTEDDMSYSLPVRDDDRISVDMSVSDGGEIRHVVAATRLIFLTDGGEYATMTRNDDAITPSSIGFSPQSFVGANTVQPLLVNNTVLFVAARGGHVMELGYSYQAGGYTTGDICLRASHMFDFNDVVDLAYQKAPYPIVWAVSSSGDLLSATYIPAQNVLGWARHSTYMGQFESVAVIPEGREDSVYVVVRRLVGGQYYRLVERFRSRNFPSIEDAFVVDCGVTVDVRGSDQTVNEVTGLEHLEGFEVAILADGAVMPNAKVVDGKVSLGRDCKIVHVGIPIAAKIQTLPARIAFSDGTMSRGRLKRVTKVWAHVLQTSTVAAGPTGGQLVENKARTNEPPGTPPALRTTDIEIMIPPSINHDGQIDLEQTQPLPFTLLAITADVDVST